MDPASKNSRNTNSRRIGEVDAVVRFKPKMMLKEEMTGGKIQSKRRKENYQIKNNFKIPVWTGL